ncbi:MAG TPA: TetR/AcrR family transcriptional regulator [Caulobacteraceae bacterium]|jgi:TetR/AcrR family acrAB operon transcriptional repressor|nr:TetR/AcrR family transcriptional regulator [Caulobacteraceae bacterium]
MAAAVKRRSQAERREEAETRLIQAATKLVAERGYGGFTLAEVSDAAGYSRGLPGHYFGSKEDLLALVVQTAVENYRNAVAQLPAAEPGMPKIAALIRRYVHKRGMTTTRAFGMLISEAMVRPRLKRTITTLNASGLAALKADLQAGIEAGNIRPDVDIDLQARMIYAFLRGQMLFAGLDNQFDGQAVGEEFIATLEARLTPSRKI